MHRTPDTSPDDARPLAMRFASTLLVAALLALGALACRSSSGPESPDRPIAEVVAHDTSLTVRDSVPSGWVTFRMTNEGRAHHSFKLKKLPAGETFDDYRRGLFAPADTLEAKLVKGRIDTATYRKKMRAAVPDWFGEVTTVGGITGLAPGHTAEITHDLVPGHYVLSCLFSTPENRTHALLGVRAGLTVTDDSSGAAPPAADLTARVSHGAFDVDAGVLSDEQTIRFVSVAGGGDTHSPFVGLFRLTPETGVDGVLEWMRRGIPLPAPVDWIGGPEPMPVRDTAYVRVRDLSPGRYAWVASEATDTTGMTHTFTVGAP